MKHKHINNVAFLQKTEKAVSSCITVSNSTPNCAHDFMMKHKRLTVITVLQTQRKTISQFGRFTGRRRECYLEWQANSSEAKKAFSRHSSNSSFRQSSGSSHDIIITNIVIFQIQNQIQIQRIYVDLCSQKSTVHPHI